MRDAKLARRYAEAFYAAAEDAGEAGELVSGFEQLLVPLADNSSFMAFWRGRRVPDAVRLQLIDEVFGELPETLRRGMKVLIDKGREEILFDLAAPLRQLHDGASGVVRATLSTAIELDEQELTEFRKMLASRLGGEVELTAMVEPELLGGFKIRYGDRVIDGSVARSVEEIRSRLSA